MNKHDKQAIAEWQAKHDEKVARLAGLEAQEREIKQVLAKWRGQSDYTDVLARFTEVEPAKAAFDWLQTQIPDAVRAVSASRDAKPFITPLGDVVQAVLDRLAPDMFEAKVNHPSKYERTTVESNLALGRLSGNVEITRVGNPALKIDMSTVKNALIDGGIVLDDFRIGGRNGYIATVREAHEPVPVITEASDGKAAFRGIRMLAERRGWDWESDDIMWVNGQEGYRAGAVIHNVKVLGTEVEDGIRRITVDVSPKIQEGIFVTMPTRTALGGPQGRRRMRKMSYLLSDLNGAFIGGLGVISSEGEVVTFTSRTSADALPAAA